MWRVSVSILLMLALAQIGLAIERESLIGLWLFDEGEGEVLKDLSGNGNDGQIVGAKWVGGKFGKALEFNGSGYVEVPASDSLNSIEKEITVLAWVQVKNWANWARVVARGNWTPAMDRYQFLLLLGGSMGDIGFCVSIKGERAKYAGRPVLKMNQWHRVAGTSDGQQVKLYIDGEFIGSSGSAAPINKVNDEPLTIGCGYANNSRASFFSGDIDEVFNKALSQEEIKGLMSGLEQLVLAVEPESKLATVWGEVKAK